MVEHSIKKADDKVLHLLSETQNKLFDLPSKREIARLCAISLSSIPGVSACRVCLGRAFSNQGNINLVACEACDWSWQSGKEMIPAPKEMQCKLDTLPGSHILPIETIDHRFGFFIFLLDQEKLFEPYKPFIKNLDNLVALALENRQQKTALKRGHTALEEEEEHYKRSLIKITTGLTLHTPLENSPMLKDTMI